MATRSLIVTLMLVFIGVVNSAHALNQITATTHQEYNTKKFYIKLDIHDLAGPADNFDLLVADLKPEHVLVEVNDKQVTLTDRQIYKSDTGNALIYIFPETEMEKDDKLEVSINMPAKTDAYPRIQSNICAITINKHVSGPFTFKVDPKSVPDQELTDGTKKSLYQFGVLLDFPSRSFWNNRAFSYFRTDNLISTNVKDKNSKVDIGAGIEINLNKDWYLPFILDAKLIGNQGFTNVSVVTTGGVKGILPLSWLGNSIWNDVVKSPLSPYLTLGLQYENRFERDVAVSANHNEKNLLRLAGQIDWKPIHLLSGKGYSDKDLSLEVKLQGWYFPNERALGGFTARRFEGHANTALFIPVQGVVSAAEKLGANIGAANTRLKLEYDVGANEGNGFVRSSSVKFGFEVAK